MLVFLPTHLLQYRSDVTNSCIVRQKKSEQVRSYYKFVKKAQRHGLDCANMNMNNIPLQEYEKKTSDLKLKIKILVC